MAQGGEHVALGGEGGLRFDRRDPIRAQRFQPPRIDVGRDHVGAGLPQQADQTAAHSARALHEDGAALQLVGSEGESARRADAVPHADRGVGRGVA